MPIVQGHWVISKLSDDMGLILLLAKGKWKWSQGSYFGAKDVRGLKFSNEDSELK